MVSKYTKWVCPQKIESIKKPKASKVKWWSWANLSSLKNLKIKEKAYSPAGKNQQLNKNHKPANLRLSSFDFSEVPEYAFVEKITVRLLVSLLREGNTTTTLPIMNKSFVHIYLNGKKIAKSNCAEINGEVDQLEIASDVFFGKMAKLYGKDLKNLNVILDWGTIGNKVPSKFYVHGAAFKINYDIVVPDVKLEMGKGYSNGANYYDKFDVLLKMNSPIHNDGFDVELLLPDGISYVSKQGHGNIYDGGHYLVWEKPTSQNNSNTQIKLTLFNNSNIKDFVLKSKVRFKRGSKITILKELRDFHVNINENNLILSVLEDGDDTNLDNDLYFLPETVNLDSNEDLEFKIMAKWRKIDDSVEKTVAIMFEKEAFKHETLEFYDNEDLVTLEYEDKIKDGVTWTYYYWNIRNNSEIHELSVYSKLKNETYGLLSFKMSVYCFDVIDENYIINQSPSKSKAPVPTEEINKELYVPVDPNYKGFDDDNKTIRPLLETDPFYTSIVLDDEELSRLGTNKLYQVIIPYLCSDEVGKYGVPAPEKGIIPDTGLNHRIGVYCDNPNVLFEDKNAREYTEYWRNVGFLIESSNERQTDLQIITSNKCQYWLNFNFTFNISWFIEFSLFFEANVSQNNLDKKFICFDSFNDTVKYSFEKLGLDNTCTVRFEYNNDEDKLYYYLNNELVNKQFLENEDNGVVLNKASQLFKSVVIQSENIVYDIEQETDLISLGSFNIESMNEIDDDDLVDLAVSDLNELDYSVRCVQTNNWENLRVNFRYGERNKVVILVFGEPFNYYPNDIKSCFSAPCVIETEEDIDRDYETDVNIPVLENEDEFDLQLRGNTNTLVFYDFKIEDKLFDEDMFINGLEIIIKGNIASTGVLSAGLLVNGEKYMQSVVYDDEKDYSDIIFQRGGYTDNWGLNYNQIQTINTIGVLISHNDLFEEDIGSVLINSIELNVFCEKLDDTAVQCWIGEDKINMVDTRGIGMFLQDLQIPFGLETDTRYFNVAGNDINTPFSQTIKPAKLKMKFLVHQGSIEDSTSCLRMITKLLSNKRNNFNKPIPKLIRFSHIPDRIFRFIVKQPVDAHLNIDSYQCDVVLEIPDGVSDKIEDTVTNHAGLVNSLVKVKPFIKLSNILYDSNRNRSYIVLTEEKTGQKMVIDDTELDVKFSRQDFIGIECDSRKCFLYRYDKILEEYQTGIDVTNAVTKVSDWFVLDNDYDFSCNGANVIYVSYNEKI